MRPLPPGRDRDEMMQDPAEALVERLLVVESMYAERQERWLGEKMRFSHGCAGSASAITPVGNTSSFNYVIIDTKSDKRRCLHGYHSRLLRPCGCTDLSVPHILREISLHILHDCNMPLNRR
jgi:hypothetical protein